MKRMRKLGLIRRLSLIAALLTSLLIVGCTNAYRSKTVIYNIDRVIRAQIPHLVKHGAEIRKKVVLNGREKVTSIKARDSLAWNEELAIFLELNVINKPIYSGQYKVDDVADKESNLRVTSYIATEDLPVKFLRIFYYKSTMRMRKIEAQYNESNTLYASSRFLTMEFEDFSNTTLLTTYSVDGGQKMFLDDSVHYTIDVGVALKR